MVKIKDIQSEKLKNKVIESTHQLPYGNLLLTDLPGEVWKPLPFAPFDDYYMVSNKGRIKRLARIVMRKNGTQAHLPEQIAKQAIQRRYNHHLKQEFYSLYFNAVVDGIKKGFPTNRLVYYTFVGFDLSDPDLIIRYKDGNGLNTNIDNLYVANRKEIPQWIVDNNHRSRLVGASDRKKWSKEEIQRWYDVSRKSVSQYDVNGRLVGTYNSRTEAAQALNMYYSSRITAVIKNKEKTAGGFMWKEGVNNPSQIEAFQPKQLSYPNRGSQKVAKYSLQGDLIAEYPSISMAARDTNINSGGLFDRIYRHSPPKDFIWKIIEENQEAPAKIEVAPYVPVKNFRKKPEQPAKPYTYPYQNHSLDDMPGEVWKAIPDMDEIYFASNYGRFKSVDRIIERNNTKLWWEGRIIHQLIATAKKDRLKGLATYITTQKRRFYFNVPHLIYKLFNGEIPPKYTIKFKDNDPLNCRAENLTIQPVSNLYKSYHKQRRHLSKYYNIRFAQYTPDGRLVAIYKNIYEAAEISGFERDKISECARGKRKTTKGFIWKFIKPDEEIEVV